MHVTQSVPPFEGPTSNRATPDAQPTGLDRGVLYSQRFVQACRCPDCAGRTLQSDDQQLVCEQCRARFVYEEGVLDLRPAGVRGAASGQEVAKRRRPKWVNWFVGAIYARHNTSRAVQQGIARVLAATAEDGLVLNVGSGKTLLRSHMINLDIVRGENVNLLGDAHSLPFHDGTISCILSQEVFEHLRDPVMAISEAGRVLTAGGLLYVQVPFIIGHHGIPYDFQRYTQAGLRELVSRARLDIVESGPSVGAGTSLYRIMVEFVAAMAAGIGLSRLYVIIKGAAAFILTPLRWFDAISPESDTLNRIHGGYYVIARKPNIGGAPAALKS